MLRELRTGISVCVTVTLLDGLVLARSAFHHSMNHRSVVVLGVATEVQDDAERLTAFEALVERVARGGGAKCGLRARRSCARRMSMALMAVGSAAATATIACFLPLRRARRWCVPLDFSM